MSDTKSYGVLRRSAWDTLEFVVNGRVVRAWKVEAPVATASELMRTCLLALGQDGWRPISHQPNPDEAVVLARVPYPAGSKLSVYGTLRFDEKGVLVLTVSGASMQRWPPTTDPECTLHAALDDLRGQGWRVHRSYSSGATVVRG